MDKKTSIALLKLPGTAINSLWLAGYRTLGDFQGVLLDDVFDLDGCGHNVGHTLNSNLALAGLDIMRERTYSEKYSQDRKTPSAKMILARERRAMIPRMLKEGITKAAIARIFDRSPRLIHTDVTRIRLQPLRDEFDLKNQHAGMQ